MYDNSLYFSALAHERSTILKTIDCGSKSFILATVHRNTNTDIPERLIAIFEGLLAIAEQHELAVIIPLHPRTKKYLQQTANQLFLEQLTTSPFIHIIDPVGFLDMIRLEQDAVLVVTDSGGVQKEAYFFKKPCIVLREETEWVELVETGAAKLVGADKSQLIDAANDFLANPPTVFPTIFGDGKAAVFICQSLVDELN